MKSRKNKTECLAEGVEAQSRLAAVLAHKVNNPLTYVMNYLFILKQTVNSSSAGEIIKKIEDGIGKATSILNGLVDASSPESEKARKIDAAEVVKMAVKSFDGAGELGIRNAVDKPHPCIGRQGSLLRALAGLIQNSLESGAKTVTIGISEDKANITISIKDDGPGINEDSKSKVFDAFFTTKPGKAGLGLYSSFISISSFGGLLWLKSSDMTGSEFCIRLPKS